jgi:hypothetical protein
MVGATLTGDAQSKFGESVRHGAGKVQKSGVGSGVFDLKFEI